MDVTLFSDAMGLLDDRYISEAILYRAQKPPARRRFRKLLAAAAAAVLLIAGCTAAALRGGSIQDWFSSCWELFTGALMSQEHQALIERLSQDIGIRQQVGDVAVTVDSAAVGDDYFYLLLRAEGVRFSSQHSYSFGVNVNLSPNPTEAGGIGCLDLRYLGTDGSGAALFLMSHAYAAMDGYVPDSTPLTVTLTLEDLFQEKDCRREKILAEGTWDFTFTLDRSQIPPAVPLPDTFVTLTDPRGTQEFSLSITQIELTNTGLRFQMPYREEPLFLSDQISAVLKSGAEIKNSGGAGAPLGDIGLVYWSFHWELPLNLDEVAAIQVGSTRIPLP